ncbi:hypothetical protein V2J09_000184 [Rumex salicifolius]
MEVAGSLRTLAMKRSFITDSTVVQVASKLSSITTLDLNYCDGIIACAFEAIGTSCTATRVSDLEHAPYMAEL